MKDFISGYNPVGSVSLNVLATRVRQCRASPGSSHGNEGARQGQRVSSERFRRAGVGPRESAKTVPTSPLPENTSTGLRKGPRPESSPSGQSTWTSKKASFSERPWAHSVGSAVPSGGRESSQGRPCPCYNPVGPRNSSPLGLPSQVTKGWRP